MPSPLRVVVTALREVRPHPNADRLDLAVAAEHPVVLPRGKYRNGERVVYFPVDTVLPDSVVDALDCRAYLHGPRKDRVGCATIRGERSFGLVASLPQPHGANWREGRNVAGYYGATKYQPPERPATGDIAPHDEAIDPFLDEYTHIPNAKLAGKMFVDGEPVVVTEKIHGTNCKIGMVGDAVVAASMKHRRKRPVGADGSMALLDGEEMRRNVYWFPWTLAGCQELIREMRERFHTVLLYGEVFGGSVQTLDYGIPKGHGLGFRAFDLKLDGRYVGWDRLVEICIKHAVPMVPVLDRCPFSAERMRALAEGDSVVSTCAQIREGVVVRLPTGELRGTPPERVIGKFIGERYLLRRRDGDDTTDV